MQLKDIFRFEKRIIKNHQGEPNKRMPKWVFPLARNHSFRPGTSWDWWLVEFDVMGNHSRLLVMLNQPKHAYRAWLGIDSPKGLILMARLEHDPTHADDWHCHVCCEDSSVATPGVVKHAPSLRTKRLRMYRHRREFGITKGNALEFALKSFGFSANDKAPEGGLFNA